MSRYHELAAKVDGFFARVTARHGGDMQCGTGCSDCCHVRLTITAIEAQAIRDELATWDAPRKQALHANAGASTVHCAALDAHGRCLVYDARPMVCRSHGAPVRMTARSLPVIGDIESCFRNFVTVTPDPDCIIDQTTLSALVLAVNGGDDTRVDLAELLASC
jgi:hypothetical protein